MDKDKDLIINILDEKENTITYVAKKSNGGLPLWAILLLAIGIPLVGVPLLAGAAFGIIVLVKKKKKAKVVEA